MKKLIILILSLFMLLTGCAKENELTNTVVGSVEGESISLSDYNEVLSDVLGYLYTEYSDGKDTLDEFYQNGIIEKQNSYEYAKEYAFNYITDLEVAIRMASETGIIYDTLGTEPDEYNVGNTTIEKKLMAQEELLNFLKSGPAAPCYVNNQEIEELKKSNPELFKKPQVNYILYRTLYIGKANAKGERYSYEQIKQNRANIKTAYEELKNGALFSDVWNKYSEDQLNNFENFEGDRLYVDNVYGEKAEIIKSLNIGEFSNFYETSEGYSIFYVENIINKTDEEITENAKEILSLNKFKKVISDAKKDMKITKKTNVIKNLEYKN